MPFTSWKHAERNRNIDRSNMKFGDFSTVCNPLKHSVYAFTHYLVHSLFGWELGQLVFIAKKRGLEPKNCPKMIFLKSDQNQNKVGDLWGSCQEFWHFFKIFGLSGGPIRKWSHLRAMKRYCVLFGLFF